MELLEPKHLEYAQQLAQRMMDHALSDDELTEMCSSLESFNLSKLQKYLFRKEVGNITNGIFGTKCFVKGRDWYKLNEICYPSLQDLVAFEEMIFKHENPDKSLPVPIQLAKTAEKPLVNLMCVVYVILNSEYQLLLAKNKQINCSAPDWSDIKHTHKIFAEYVVIPTKRAFPSAEEMDKALMELADRLNKELQVLGVEEDYFVCVDAAAWSRK